MSEHGTQIGWAHQPGQQDHSPDALWAVKETT